MMEQSSSAASLSPAPAWPRAGVSAALIRDGAVLLIERGTAPFAGLWSLPGGSIEPGETAEEAIRREVREETGLTANVMGLTGVHDVILRGDDGSLRGHYVLTTFFGRPCEGDPAANGDARSARMVPLEAVQDLPLTPDLLPIIQRAARLVCGEGRVLEPRRD
jgi:ADP-ribose pyrophosphatase YjhB (NUDIX family)